jgi:Fe-S cluster assembly protein SufD
MEQLSIKENSSVVKTFSIVQDDKLQINLEPNSNLTVVFLVNSLIAINFDCDLFLDTGSHIEAFLFDLNNASTNIVIQGIANNNSQINYFSGVIAEQNEKKNHSVSFTNAREDSVCIQKNYGIVKGNGNLTIKGVGRINKNSKRSNNKQDSKIIIFDNDSVGVIEPLLYIDENDVQASHASALGKINEDQIYYLCSKGLSERESKKLIVSGFFNPIINKIADKEKVQKKLEEKMNYEF